MPIQYHVSKTVTTLLQLQTNLEGTEYTMIVQSIAAS